MVDCAFVDKAVVGVCPTAALVVDIVFFFLIIEIVGDTLGYREIKLTGSDVDGVVHAYFYRNTMNISSG